MSIKQTLFIIFVFTLISSSIQTAICATQVSNLDYKPGELIVRFAPKADGKQRTKVERESVLASIDGGIVKHLYKLVPGLTVVKLPENVPVKNVLSLFNNTNGILYAVPNYRAMVLLSIPDDTRFDDLWGMHNTGQTGGTEDADIDAPEAWDITTDSDVVVAVIDTGVDYNHPDLADNMWTNDAELNGITGIDDDGNGYIDDIYGYDFCRC